MSASGSSSATARLCSAIEAAYRVDEVKDIRDQALAFEMYARQAKNVEAERQACEIRLRAERKAGQLLKGMEKAKPGPRPQKIDAAMALISETNATLEELGVSPKQSAAWQKLAAVPQRDFDRAIAESERPTTTGTHRGDAGMTLPILDVAAAAVEAGKALAAKA